MSVNTVQNDGSLSRVAGGTLWADSPIGTILPYGGTSAPSGWMICDGTSLLRASYPELFAVIGTAFGSADSTHFNIPDMRESVPKGAGLTGHTVGAHVKSGGLAVGEFLDDRLQDHTHELSETPNYSYLTGSGNYKVVPVSGGSIQTGTVSNTYRKGDTTEVKAVGVNYIIKAKMVALPADFLAKVDEAVEDVYGDIIPSDASSSNKLVALSQFGAIEPITYSDSDLKTFTENVCKTINYAGSPDILNSTNINCGFMNITQGTDQVTQILYQFNMGKIWVRYRYGSWTAWRNVQAPPKHVRAGTVDFNSVMLDLGLSGYPNKFKIEVQGTNSHNCYAQGVVFRSSNSVSAGFNGITSNCFIASNTGGSIAVYSADQSTHYQDCDIICTPCE